MTEEIEMARPRCGLGVRTRTGLRAGLLGDFGFARGMLCVGRGFNGREERLWSEEEDEGGLFSSLGFGVSLNAAANELE